MTAMRDDLGRTMHNSGLAGIGFFVVFATLNAFILVRNLIERDRQASMIPLAGGLGGFLGCLPIASLCYYAAAPLLLDAGTATALAWGSPYPTTSRMPQLLPNPMTVSPKQNLLNLRPFPDR
jgi:hypothetical protein